MLFNFPEIKTSNGLMQQIEKIQEEVDELRRAAMTTDTDHTWDELMDVGQSFETAVRIAERDYGMNRHKARCLNERKNTVRGYFDD